MRILFPLAAVALVAGCVSTTESPEPVSAPSSQPAPISASVSSRNFADVVRRVEPVAERECRARTRGVSCDYAIRVDERTNQPPNAFQTLEKGRPVIVFTRSLIKETRNADELAFVLGHEAAHHIEGHIPKTQQSAIAGALILGTLAAIGGAGDGAIRTAQDVGATVGARTFSKEMELEADALGTVIAARAGYDPVRGSAYFSRIPDPGDRFLGSHPPNKQRQAVVRKTAAGL